MKPPLWYTANEVALWLKVNGYPDRGDLPVFLAKHFQEAFEEGWNKCLRELRNPNCYFQGGRGCNNTRLDVPWRDDCKTPRRMEVEGK